MQRKPANNHKRMRGVIEKRLRSTGDAEAANYIAQLEGREQSAQDKAEAARVALVLHTKDLLRTLKRWGQVKPA